MTKSERRKQIESERLKKKKKLKSEKETANLLWPSPQEMKYLMSCFKEMFHS